MRRGLRLPLLAQVLALLALTVFAVQLMTVVLIGVLPRPRPTIYRAGDVALALSGQAASRTESRLVARLQSAPPSNGSGDQFEGPATRRILAELLGVPESRVWFSIRGRARPGPLASPFASPPNRPPANVARSLGSPSSPQLSQASAPAPSATPQARLRFASNWPLFGAFTAGLERTDGRWVVIRPAPEPFPNPDQRRVALWLFGCLLLVIPIAYLFARRITRPMARFAQAAEALGLDPQAPPTEVEGPAEIARAAAAFNLMQSRVRNLVEDRTAMFGAISHDLKTPLARIRFRVERDPVGSRAAILQDLRQMDEMLSQVLAFVRGASEPKERLPLDLRSVIECVVDGAPAPEPLLIEDGPPIFVRGDPLDLTRLFGNLVDNALKYGQGGAIRIHEENGEARVEISDAGAGLSGEEMEKVFAPFYRSEGSRGSGGGVGLGLSVARSIARAHGGDVKLSSGPGSGLTATVTLPLERMEARAQIPA